MQEQLRRRIRALVRLIVEAKRLIVYAEPVDQLGDITRNVALRHGRSRLLLTLSAEARAYLRVLEDHGALQRPRRNRPLAAEDLTGLEQMVIDAGVGTATCIATGLGLGPLRRQQRPRLPPPPPQRSCATCSTMT